MRDGIVPQLLARVAGLPGAGRGVWAAALLFFGLGDVATTAVGVRAESVAETGPLVAALLGRHGLVALVALKLGVFGAGYAAADALSGPRGAAAPLALAVVGVAVTAWNAAVLLGAH